jgi:hypothetical protein
MKKYFFTLAIVIIILAGGIITYSKISRNKIANDKNNVSSYDECVAAENIVQESYPSICRTPNGKSFTQDIGNELEKTDLITIENPRPNAVITSPLIIFGQARGSWFFEASFPIKLYDQNNKLIAQAIAQAQGEWMTEEFVNFKAEMKFTAPASNKGTLILEKDNPSGLRENDDQLIVPIIFR